MSTSTNTRCTYPNVHLKDKPEWITQEITRETIEWCQSFGYHLHQKEFTSSQLRKFFGFLKKIQLKGYEKTRYKELLKLKPLLAYAVGKDRKRNQNNTEKTAIEKFYDEISAAIDIMDGQDKEAFNNFIQIVEAIVAYHKEAGGE